MKRLLNHIFFTTKKIVKCPIAFVCQRHIKITHKLGYSLSSKESICLLGGDGSEIHIVNGNHAYEQMYILSKIK